MLVYHPAFDVNHCIYRILKLLNGLDKDKIYRIEQIRILDFYLLFPSQLENITFPKNAMKYRKYIPSSRNLYESVNEEILLFNKMKTYQYTALKTLASYNLIDADHLIDDIVKRTQRLIPEELRQKFKSKTEQEEKIFELLTKVLSEISLIGEKGLKSRTNLMTCQYDSV